MPRTVGNSIGASIGAREGCVEVVHTYPFQYNTTGIDSGGSGGVLIDSITASSDAPVELEISLNIITGFNDSSTNEIQLGSTQSGSDLAAFADPETTIAGYYPASNAATKVRITSNTDLYLSYTQGSSDASAGSAILMIREFAQNILPVV